MPTYEYRCPAGHEFERFQRMSDPPRAKCPVCGRSAVRQISGGAGLIFKGSGFYITDYGKDGKGPRKEEESQPKAEPSAKPAESGQSGSPESGPPPAAEQPEKSGKSEKPEKPPKGEKKSSRKKGTS